MGRGPLFLLDRPGGGFTSAVKEGHGWGWLRGEGGGRAKLKHRSGQAERVRGCGGKGCCCRGRLPAQVSIRGDEQRRVAGADESGREGASPTHGGRTSG